MKIAIILIPELSLKRFCFLASYKSNPTPLNFFNFHYPLTHSLSLLSSSTPSLSLRVLPNSMAQEVEAVVVAENGAKASPVVFTAAKPWLVVDAPKANDAVQFYKAAFGAEEVSRVNHPKRKADQELPLILSAELKLGSSIVVVSDLTDDSSSPYVFSKAFCPLFSILIGYSASLLLCSFVYSRFCVDLFVSLVK